LPSEFAFTAKYLKKSNVQGSLVYVERSPGSAGRVLRVPALRAHAFGHGAIESADIGVETCLPR
jgi:hypothetical protein